MVTAGVDTAPVPLLRRRRAALPATGHPFLDAGTAGSGAVLAFAHRGGARHPEIADLENTLAAFRHAAALGYRYLETDLHVTADGVLVAFHDRLLDRVTDVRGHIEQLTLAEVSDARVGGREGVPTLAQLFEELPDARFNLDLKSRAAVPALVGFLDERDAWDRVLVCSFSRRRLRRFRRLAAGRAPTAASPAEIAAFRLLPVRLADRLTGGGVDVLQLPHRWGPLPVCTRGLVRRAQAVGKHVHVWTVDDPVLMGRLVADGVDGLMTDRTDLLKQVLRERGLWGQQ